ncbi:CoA transferase [Frankia nepalensis]|uniref:CoA transferase n=1 Tax=Frankia nepalensis TaxID=1836974 RepID=A0A937RHK9_9ACTN|nr:CoA transferase [Frankia nepalensis]MBL7497059.1 CoA transferase [Frankia nepalensis]MBL7513612.1 CoA transferase [Frankia nepalensis]MBL7632376.1 CoA transferase [Frankia nepalensis]
MTDQLHELPRPDGPTRPDSAAEPDRRAPSDPPRPTPPPDTPEAEDASGSRTEAAVAEGDTAEPDAPTVLTDEPATDPADADDAARDAPSVATDEPVAQPAGAAGDAPTQDPTAHDPTTHDSATDDSATHDSAAHDSATHDPADDDGPPTVVLDETVAGTPVVAGGASAEPDAAAATAAAPPAEGAGTDAAVGAALEADAADVDEDGGEDEDGDGDEAPHDDGSDHAEAATLGGAAPGELTKDADAEIANIIAEFARVVGDPLAAERLTVTGPPDVLPSVYRVTTVATVAAAAAAHGAALLWSARSRQECLPVSVDTRHAAAAFRSERLLRVGGQPAPSPWDTLSGYYQAGDGRWIQLHCNLPHHRAGALELLRARAEPAAVARAVARHDAAQLEAELQAMGMCATMARDEQEWWAHPAGRAVAGLPLVEIDRIGDDVAEARGGPSMATPARGTRAPAVPAQALSTQAQALASPARPAAGLRVLDMTRVIAGPVCGRTLAAFGADVLRVGAAHLPDARPLVIDTSFGKRSTFLNLRVAADARRLRELVAQADVVIQAYRPKALDRLGFGPEALARIRPGIVCATISAYGRQGPWSGLRGFDSLVQTASGIALAGTRAAGSDRPLPLPAQALDHATGHLAAFGVLAALAHREIAGGSWHVRLSLAQTGRWLMGLGERDTLDLPEPREAEIAPFRRVMRSEFGELSYIAPPGSVGGAEHGYDRPPSSLGTHQAGWAPIR